MVDLGVRGNNMAILTRKQIAEIITIVSNQSTSKDLYSEFCEWNEKQLAQFEPDWSKAPKYVVGAALNLAWLTENGNWALGYQIAKYDRPAPVITPHPHAAMMLKYAEVAARRPDPWVEFEWRDFDKTWRKAGEMISFSSHTEYRHVGDEKEAV